MFLKYFDALDQCKESEGLLEGKPFTPLLLTRYRGSSWPSQEADGHGR